jgi:hypothetical protein
VHLLLPIGYWMIQPRVVTGASNPKEATHHLNAELIPMQLDEFIRSPNLAWRLGRRHGPGLQLQVQMLDLVQEKLVTPLKP